MAKIKYQIDERKFIYIEVSTDKEIQIVKEMNADMERFKARERLYRKKNVSLDQLFSKYDYEFSSDEPSIIDVLIEEERNQLIKEAIMSLPKRQRMVIIEVFWNNKSLRQISREWNLNIKSVSEPYHIAMKKLRHLLKDIF